MRSSYQRLVDKFERTCSRGRWAVNVRLSRRRRRSTAAAIERLPLELLWMVFERLASQRVFLNLSKTSKALRWAVEPLLYGKIFICEKLSPKLDVHRISHAQSRLLSKQLRLHPQLGKRVRHISVLGPRFRRLCEESLLWYDLLRLLSRTPNLQRLEVRWHMINILSMFRRCAGMRLSPRPCPQLAAHSEGQCPHGFDFLADLTLGPGHNEPCKFRMKALSDFVPVLRLTALKRLTLISFGIIWTCKESFHMPTCNSGIQSLKLVDTTLSGFSFVSRQIEPGSTSSDHNRRVILEPAIKQFLSAIKEMKEFVWLYNPILLSWCEFDWSTLSSDLQCHATTLERLTIDAMSSCKNRVQRIGSLQEFKNLSFLSLPHGALIGEQWLPLEHEFENEVTAIDSIPSLLPHALQELVICPSERYLEPAVRLAVWLEEKRRHESCFHAPGRLWIGFRSKRYPVIKANGQSLNLFADEGFADEVYLETIAPMPYGDDEHFSFRSWNVTVALQGVPETFRSYVGHFMKKYHDNMRDVLEDPDDSETLEDSEHSEDSD